ncbi:hypothetical protein Tco_0837507 [Tanacetum coccineum]
MMIPTTAFIRGEAHRCLAKIKGHASWKAQDQSKRHTSERRSDFRSQEKDEGLTGLPPLQEHPKKYSRLKQEGPVIDHALDKGITLYNIIGRPSIREIQAVPSTAHRMLKFPIDKGIVTICSTILIPAECAIEVAIEGTLSAKGRTKLCLLMKKNLNIFAWQPSDITRVPRSIAEHRLNIQEGYSPVRQKKRGQAPERAKAIQAEDCYPIPEIDWKVESLYGLDAYKGYQQIQMAESDEEKTAFHTVPTDQATRFTQHSSGPLPSNGKLASLNRFLSKSAEKSLPLFKTLKKCIKKSDFHWTPEAEQARLQRLHCNCQHPVPPSTRTSTDGLDTEKAQFRRQNVGLHTRKGTEFTYALRFQFTVSNNEAAYEALIASLRIAAQMRVRNVHIPGEGISMASQSESSE